MPKLTTSADHLHRYEPELNTGCWLWTGYLHPKGYGYVEVGGRKHRAHRLFYQELVGPIPAGMILCHKCDTPACVNPAHVFVGTDADNVADMKAKGRLVTRGLKVGSGPGRSAAVQGGFKLALIGGG